MARAGTNHKGGRPKGVKTAVTLEREKVIASFNNRVLKASDLLFNAQLTLAQGQTFLYKIEKRKKIGPKGGISYERQKPEIVTTQWEIEAFLEGEIENGNLDDPNDPAATYYFLTTKEPNNQAIDSLLNRAMGKPKESLEITGVKKLLVDF